MKHHIRKAIALAFLAPGVLCTGLGIFLLGIALWIDEGLYEEPKKKVPQRAPQKDPFRGGVGALNLPSGGLRDYPPIDGQQRRKTHLFTGIGRQI